MLQKLNAHLLILLFIALFSYESVEYFCGKNFEHQETASGILELEEEGGSSEESKEENDEEIKIEDNFYNDSEFYSLPFLSKHFISSINLHYQASDYSSQIYSPPEHI